MVYNHISIMFFKYYLSVNGIFYGKKMDFYHVMETSDLLPWSWLHTICCYGGARSDREQLPLTWLTHLPVYLKTCWLLFTGHWYLNRIPVNRRHWPNVVLMLGQRRRRWANIKSALGHVCCQCNRIHWSYVVLMLGQRRRRWASNKSALDHVSCLLGSRSLGHDMV